MSAQDQAFPTCVPGASVYEVGGAVRDALLGLPATDCDWVVVGSTAEAMVEAGFLPVGRDFPVFLHPVTRDEFALARSERKSAPGYRGFVVHADPDVTLEQDLARRDLTINAMARASDGTIVDPFRGRDDLRAGVLRHVCDAFTEDPVRILRLARFAARFETFTVAPETMDLMRSMVAAGEVDALVPERVWQELSRGLMEAKPSRMIEVLRACGALARLLPEFERLAGVPQTELHHPEVDSYIHANLVLDMSAQLKGSLPVRYACLVHDLGKGTTPVSVLPRHLGHEARSVDLAREVAVRLRVPKECVELGEVVAREHGNLHRSSSLGAAATTRLLDRCDAFRKPERFAEVLLACECDSRGRLNFENRPYEPRERLAACLQAALSVDTAQVAALAIARGQQGPKIGEAILNARRHAIAALRADNADADAEELDSLDPMTATAAAETKTPSRNKP